MKLAPFLSLVLLVSARSEVARWADPTLPLNDGLELWLDATRENEAREAHYMNRLAEGQGVELWHDSSGHSRHLSQWTATARPTWRQGVIAFGGDVEVAAYAAVSADSAGVLCGLDGFGFKSI